MIIVFILCISISWAGITDNRTINWSPGFGLNEIQFDSLINIKDYGAYNDGVTPNDEIISKILDENSNGKVKIIFESGRYLFRKPISLRSGIGLAGDGLSADKPELIFDLESQSNAINVTGNLTEDVYELERKPERGDTELILKKNNLSLKKGIYLLRPTNDNDLITSDWAKQSTGQVVRIFPKGDNEYEVDMINRNYNSDAHLIKINPAEEILISGIKIIRKDQTPHQTSNISFKYAFNCHVQCIESEYTNFSHIEVSYSNNIIIENSHLSKAFDYGGGGKGYGVTLQFSSSDCAVRYCIFDSLRHAMLVQAGANGNVFAFNYSKNPFWTDVLLPSNSSGDIVCHGNYPYLNLFEHNICQNIVIDNSHGTNGPFNTFFRNRAETYGIFMNEGAGDSTNIISNEVTSESFLQGLFILTGQNNLVCGNIIKGNLQDNNTNDIDLLSNSEESCEKCPSEFFPIGEIENYNKYFNAAYLRDQMGIKTLCDSPILSLKENISQEKLSTMISLSKAISICENNNFRLYDITGKLVENCDMSVGLYFIEGDSGWIQKLLVF